MFHIESTSHLIQLMIALSGGIVIFVFSYMGFQRMLFKILIILIPFQFITSQYGSINMAMTYVIGAAMFFNRSWIKDKGKKKTPLLWAIGILILAYLLSWSLAPKMFWTKNLFYFIVLGSNVCLFYMSYYFVSDKEDFIKIIELLFICNILVILYCIIQLIIGFQEFSVLGIKEFGIERNRADYRIVGPWGAAGPFAEYIVIQCLLLGYYVATLGKYKKLAVALIFFNVAALIGTGNRGGFICIILAFILFMFSFRKLLGPKKIAISTVGIIIIFFLASFYMIKYTDFNVMYQRLLRTTMVGGVPDTRSGWPYVVEKIFDKPILGHGPRLIVKTQLELQGGGNLPKGEIGFYPHNLYLYILYTMGIVGLLAYGVLGWGYIVILRQAKRLNHADSFLSGLPQLGLIIVFIFLVDQMKVEFLRFVWSDYQHYISVLFGMLCATKKVIENENTSAVVLNETCR